VVVSYIDDNHRVSRRILESSNLHRWSGEFPGIFVRDPALVPNRPSPGVETLMDSRRVRSLCPNGTTNASGYHYRTPKEQTSMIKYLLSVALMAVTLGGCELYFGNENGGGGGGSGNPGGGSGTPTGGACTTNDQCAAGCSCDMGTCVENGFCAKDGDCPTGYVCDDRSTCVQDPTCSDANPCTQLGQVCNAQKTCVDQSCSEVIATTCTVAPAACPAGQVATSVDGCYIPNGCEAITDCGAAPLCERLNHEGDCTARATDCASVYNGLNCKKPDGTACKSGDANCTCASFVFAKCQDRGASSRQQAQTAGGAVYDVGDLN
jgi:hypothetical protein